MAMFLSFAFVQRLARMDAATAGLQLASINACTIGCANVAAGPCATFSTRGSTRIGSLACWRITTNHVPPRRFRRPFTRPRGAHVSVAQELITSIKGNSRDAKNASRRTLAADQQTDRPRSAGFL